MSPNVGRNLADVLDQIITMIPESEPEFGERIARIRSGVFYKPPEVQWSWGWRAFSQALADRFPGVEKVEDYPEWAQRVGETFRGPIH